MKNNWIVIILIVLLTAVIVYFATVTQIFGLAKGKADASWKAIFLTNGQVYFGHLHQPNSQFVDLTDIYYLQIDQQSALQPSKDINADSKINLVELGNELHGPTSEMKINRDQILFTETLKPDSKVVSAISDYLKSKQK